MEPSPTLDCLTSTLEVKRRASNIVMFNVISTCNLDIGAVEIRLENSMPMYDHLLDVSERSRQDSLSFTFTAKNRR